MRLRQSLLEWEVIHRCGEELHSFTFKVPQLKFSFIMAVRVFEVTDWCLRVSRPQEPQVRDYNYLMAFKSPKVVKGMWGEVSTKSMRIRWAGPSLHPEKRFQRKDSLIILCSTTCLSASGAAAAGVSAALSLAPCSQTIIINNLSQFNTIYIRDNVSLARISNNHLAATISPEGELEPAGNWGRAGFSAPESCLV